MYALSYPHDVFAELDRLQREIQQSLDLSPSIRGRTRGSFPAMNVGGTPQSVEVYAFTPGVDPATIEVNLENGVLAIEGERKAAHPNPSGDAASTKPTRHIQERFVGRFRRVVTLPDDIDANAVHASFRDGVLHISIKRREAAQARRITIH
jgi:HSP20 family protein